MLQPTIVLCQQPNVVFNQIKIVSMRETEKIAFSQRLNMVADMLSIPPKGENRQKLLGKMFGVSQEAARKWLAGEGLPQMQKCIEIAKKASVSIEWLLTGRGIAQYENTPEAQVLKAMQNMDAATKYQAVKICDTLAEPAHQGNGTDK
jgi:transcriptional regulator with XRE-family HTH domain